MDSLSRVRQTSRQSAAALGIVGAQGRQEGLRGGSLHVLLIVVLMVSLTGLVQGEPNRVALPGQQKLAVVIGIDRYAQPSWKPLEHARKGAVAIVRLLRERGFEVRELLDEAATRDSILLALTDVARRLESGDQVLIYFAGHGHTETLGERDWGYVVPQDGKGTGSYISMRELENISEQMALAKHQLFLVDACYGGLLGLKRNRLSSFARSPRTLRELQYRQARLYITAGGKNQVVVDDDGPEGHSLFTGQVLRAIEGGLADHNDDGFVTFAELASYLEAAASNRYQTPSYGVLPGHEGGSLLFAVKPGAKVQDVARAEPESVTDGRSTQRRGVTARLPEAAVEVKPPQTYRVRKGSPTALDDLGLTAAVSFGTLERVAFATLMVNVSGGASERQAAFEAGTAVTFDLGGRRFQGMVLGIDWGLEEVSFTLGEVRVEE